MSARITLLADASIEDRLRAAVPELNGNLARWQGDVADVYIQRSLDAVMRDAPDVVVFGPALTADSMLELAAELDRDHPGLELVLLAEPNPRLWERAARSGVREIVSPTADDQDIRAAIARTISTVESRGRRRADAVSAAAEHRAVVVVRSPKGGSGKTMVASNVATTLAADHPGEVVLVDLDLQYGDMASALGMDPSYTIADATANVELTPTALKTLLSRHTSGLYALCAPSRPEDAAVITGEDVTAVLGLLQAAFRYVIVDTSAGTDDRSLAAMAEATDIVLVCSMDVSSVRAARKDIDAGHGGSTTATRHVVLNRSNSKVGLELRDIEAALGVAVDVQVGSARSVPLHMNCGIPVVVAEPSSPVAKQLRELVHRLVPATTSTARARRWRR